MKPNILLLHGALGSKKQLDPIKQMLGKNFDVHSIDFAGHGDDVSTDEYSITLFTQNVMDFLNKNQIDTIDIFGYSMGGYVALSTALHFPDRINTIVTLGTKFNWSQESAAQEVKMLQPEIIETKVPHFAEKLRTAHSHDWKAVMNKTATMMLNMGEGKKLAYDDFKLIHHKVMIGVGSDDKMVSIEEAEKVAKLLPKGTLQILEGVEHPIDKVEPQIIANYITKSL